jgi:hypothetical protein
MRSLLTRLKRLEDIRAGEQRYSPLQLEIGYLKKLPPEYTGPRHTVTVRQTPQWALPVGRSGPARRRARPE